MKTNLFLAVFWVMPVLVFSMEYRRGFKRIPTVKKVDVDSFLNNVENVLKNPNHSIESWDNFETTSTEKRFRDVLRNIKICSEKAQRDIRWLELVVGMNAGVVFTSILYWYLNRE